MTIFSKEINDIILRRWKTTDDQQLFKLASDPDIGQRAGWPPHQSVEESREIIKSVFMNDTTWAIVSTDTEEIIGAIGYGDSCDCKLPAREGEAVVGYWIGKPYWNKGLCTKALSLLIDHLRKHTTIKSLISGHFTDNPASGRVLEKCGFKPTGQTCFDNSLYNGVDRPIRVLRLTLGRQ